jgi:hypothetical protein
MLLALAISMWTSGICKGLTFPGVNRVRAFGDAIAQPPQITPCLPMDQCSHNLKLAYAQDVTPLLTAQAHPSGSTAQEAQAQRIGNRRVRDSAPDEARNALRGEITVSKGDIFQRSDIEIRVVVNTNEDHDLANVIVRESDDALDMDYKYSGNLNTQNCILSSLFGHGRRSQSIHSISTPISLTLASIICWSRRSTN